MSGDLSRNKKKWISIILVSAITGALSAFVTVRFLAPAKEYAVASTPFFPQQGPQMNLKKGEVPEPLKDCQDIFDKYCKEVEPGNGRILTCLKQHEDELNANCKTLVNKLTARR